MKQVRGLVFVVLAFPTVLSASDAPEHSIIYSGGLWLGVPFFPSGTAKSRNDGDGNVEIRLAYRYRNTSFTEFELAYARGIGWWSDNNDYRLLSASLVRAWPEDSRNQLFVRAGANAHQLSCSWSAGGGTRREIGISEGLGWQAGAGWRYRTSWGEVGVDLNASELHPVRVYQAHFNLGYRF